jgi:tRNA(fMet)-specific endonuclease VapC
VTRLMLDTNICVDVLRGRSREIRRHLERTVAAEVAISSIVAAELWTGVIKSRAPAVTAQSLRRFLVFVAVLDWPAEAAQIYGEIRAHLEATGKSIGAMDMLIAAHAIHEKAKLITNNLGEFRRVSGLKVEAWPKS